MADTISKSLGSEYYEGEGATIRRWVLTRLKTLFDENGIEIASPTVKVAAGQAAAEFRRWEAFARCVQVRNPARQHACEKPLWVNSQLRSSGRVENPELCCRSAGRHG